MLSSVPQNRQRGNSHDILLFKLTHVRALSLRRALLQAAQGHELVSLHESGQSNPYAVITLGQSSLRSSVAQQVLHT